MEKHIAKNYTIETLKFVLRIPSRDDLPHVFSATKYQGFNDGMLWEPPQSMAELDAPLHRSLAAWDSGRGYTFTIVDKKSNDFMGRISIRKTDVPTVWNVGFWTHPRHQGKGIMTESLAGIINFGFIELAATAIEADHAIWNKASEKVLLNNGMTFVCYIEKGFQKNGAWIDENKLAISYEDWQRKQQQ